MGTLSCGQEDRSFQLLNTPWLGPKSVPFGADRSTTWILPQVPSRISASVRCCKGLYCDAVGFGQTSQPTRVQTGDTASPTPTNSCQTLVRVSSASNTVATSVRARKGQHVSPQSRPPAPVCQFYVNFMFVSFVESAVFFGYPHTAHNDRKGLFRTRLWGPTFNSNQGQSCLQTTAATSALLACAVGWDGGHVLSGTERSSGGSVGASIMLGTSVPVAYLSKPHHDGQGRSA